MKTIKSVEKAILIVNCIAEHNGELTLTRLSEKLDMTITTLYGFIYTLEQCHMIQKNPDSGTYSLGSLIARYALVSSPRDLLIRECTPFLDEIRDETGETVHLAFPLSQNQILYAAKAESRNPFRLTSLVGTTENAEHSAIGVMLYPSMQGKNDSTMTFTEVNGISCCIKYEPPMDAYCIAAPLSIGGNSHAAALSLVVPRIRFHNGPQSYTDKLTKGICRLQDHLADKKSLEMN